MWVASGVSITRTISNSMRESEGIDEEGREEGEVDENP
jgi:hypothetical protein